jgi:hypothetical protein
MTVVQSLMDKLKVDRNVLLIAERIKLIDELYNNLDFPSKSKFYRSETLAELTKYFTFATPGKCRDGIDAPWKDAMIVTSPISNIDQLSGRVVRSYQDKKTPIIIDMVDYGCKDISRTVNTRLKFYESKKWPIQFLLFKDNKIIKVDRETAYDILKGK